MSFFGGSCDNTPDAGCPLLLRASASALNGPNPRFIGSWLAHKSSDQMVCRHLGNALVHFHLPLLEHCAQQRLSCNFKNCTVGDS